MDDSLSFYSFREFLSIHEVTSLVFGIDPDDNWTPNGYSGMYELLKETLHHDLVKLRDLSRITRDDISFALIEPYTLLNEDIPEKACQKLGIFFGAYETRKEAINDENIELRNAKIKKSELIRWFEFKGLKPAFFFPDIPPKRSEEKPQNQYRTRLMNIMDKAIARYYGVNFDVNDKDTYPNQDDVIDWLMGEFSLSKRRASAIEILIAPRDGNYPEG